MFIFTDVMENKLQREKNRTVNSKRVSASVCVQSELPQKQTMNLFSFRVINGYFMFFLIDEV